MWRQLAQGHLKGNVIDPKWYQQHERVCRAEESYTYNRFCSSLLLNLLDVQKEHPPTHYPAMWVFCGDPSGLMSCHRPLELTPVRFGASTVIKLTIGETRLRFVYATET